MTPTTLCVFLLLATLGCTSTLSKPACPREFVTKECQAEGIAVLGCDGECRSKASGRYLREVCCPE